MEKRNLPGGQHVRAGRLDTRSIPPRTGGTTEGLRSDTKGRKDQRTMVPVKETFRIIRTDELGGYPSGLDERMSMTGMFSKLVVICTPPVLSTSNTTAPVLTISTRSPGLQVLIKTAGSERCVITMSITSLPGQTDSRRTTRAYTFPPAAWGCPGRYIPRFPTSPA